MFNSLLTNDTFKAYYKVESTGAWAGIVTSMYQIGGMWKPAQMLSKLLIHQQELSLFLSSALLAIRGVVDTV